MILIEFYKILFEILIIKKKYKYMFKFFIKKFSIIISLEKNPDINGNPHNDILKIKNIVVDKGIEFFKFP